MTNTGGPTTTEPSGVPMHVQFTAHPRWPQSAAACERLKLYPIGPAPHARVEPEKPAPMIDLDPHADYLDNPVIAHRRPIGKPVSNDHVIIDPVTGNSLCVADPAKETVAGLARIWTAHAGRVSDHVLGAGRVSRDHFFRYGPGRGGQQNHNAFTNLRGDTTQEPRCALNAVRAKHYEH